MLGSRLNNLFFYILIATVVGLLGWLSSHYDQQWDWSADSRNSLSAASQEIVKRIDNTVKITAFVTANKILRKPVRAIINPYLAASQHFELAFVSPETEPDRVRKLGLSGSGALLVEYKGQQEILHRLSEGRLTNALARLAADTQGWILTLRGHGERSLTGQANHDLGDFGAALLKKGYQIQDLTLSATPAIPDNTRLIVLAGAQTEYLPGELNILRQYIENGGHFLWLTDPDRPASLNDFAKHFGLHFLPGTIVDANGKQLGIDSPTIAIVPNYPDHPVTEAFDQLSVYPQASALTQANESRWSMTPVLRTLPRTWNETGPLKGSINRDPQQQEQEGPLDLAYALTREHQAKSQRLIIVGDGDFLSNSFIGNAGNLELGLRMIRWLTHNDDFINIPSSASSDLNFELSKTAAGIMGLGFLIIIPLVFFITGAFIWRRRRRRQ